LFFKLNKAKDNGTSNTWYGAHNYDCSVPEVDPKVHLDGSVHDVPGGPLHAVVQAGVDNVLLGGSGHTLVKLSTGKCAIIGVGISWQKKSLTLP
jgi:hypothetical protein